MLKEVIKRDGSIQPAQIEKALGWVKWAGAGLGDRVDIIGAIRYVFSNLGEREKTSTINLQLREYLIGKGTSPNLLAAGRLMMADFRKDIHGSRMPLMSEYVEAMQERGIIRQFSYTKDEWTMIDRIMDHQRDFMLDSAQVQQVMGKYALKNVATKRCYETPQYTFMRMAIAIAEVEKVSNRVVRVAELYDAYSKGEINQPTPNYNNLSTFNAGLASCCVIASADDVPSLAAGIHAQYVMTCQAAGIGHVLLTRSKGDPIRNGVISHHGKYRYLNADTAIVKANTQGSRGGASTEYISVFDPEIQMLARLQNPRTPTDQQNRDIHFSYQMNRVFTEKVVNDEKIALFNVYTAPQLVELFYSPHIDKFREAYEQYCQDDSIKKTWVNARDLIVTLLEEGCAAGTVYLNFVDEMNRHTPLKDVIYTSNLCGEAMLNSSPYASVTDFYLEEDHGRGEIGLCSLGAINIAKVHYKTEAEIEQIYYLAASTADTCIDLTAYALPHVGYTAKRRRHIGIGVVGLAELMARENLKYNSTEGKAFMHFLAERHMYYMIKASLRLARERGVAEWMHKTRWPEGWLPIDTYCKEVDNITPHVLHYDHEALRQEVIANGGLRNSSLVNHMPGESSCKATGTTNGLYRVRQLRMLKSDADQVLEWAAPDDDLLGDNYDIAWKAHLLDQVDTYAIWQKHADQGISCDYHMDRSSDLTLHDDDLLNWYLRMSKTAQKSVYYINTKTSGGQVKIEDKCQEGNCKM